MTIPGQMQGSPGAVNSFIDNTKRHMVLPIFNRATYSRCLAFIKKISQIDNIDLTVVLSSSLLWKEYGKASEDIKEELRNVSFTTLDMDEHPTTHAGMCEAAAVIITKLTALCVEKKFDGMLVVADRYETLPAALVGAYLHIPLFHLQGGEVTGNIDEKIRHAVTKLSDYHFTCTDLAKKYIYAMGEELGRIFKTGCPSLDLCHISKFAKKLESFIIHKNFCICIFHPETDKPDEAFEQTRIVFESVLAYCAWSGFHCYWFYPNSDPGRENIIAYLDEALKTHSKFFSKAVNEAPKQFTIRLNKARLIVGNSSCALREASFLGVPAINIGSRQHLRERSWNVRDVDYVPEQILATLQKQHETHRYAGSYLYGDGHSGAWMYLQLHRIKKWKLKSALDYPIRGEFRELHMGETRFENHRKAYKPKRYESKVKRNKAVGVDIPGESGSPGTGNGKGPGTTP